jgi:acetate kinase
VRPDSVLVVNAGSSSLKLRLLDSQDRLLDSRDLDFDGDWDDAIAAFLDRRVDAIGHRVVHGGARFVDPIRLTGHVEDRLLALSELAPLHSPPALRVIHETMRLAPATPGVACFDTAFHATLPPEASTYALPGSWAKRWNLRRFGFHGLSHAYASRRAAELVNRPLAELRLVTAHLGAGASLAAVAGGKSIDTTMGFTPLDGLVMATRSGAVDPGLLLWTQRHGPLQPDEIEHALEHEAGLLGISERSGDMRDVVAGAEAGDQRCQLAFDVYSHRLAASIAAMATSLGGLDALVFTGGVGEHQPTVRAEACKRLEFLGLELDPDENSAGSPDSRISPGSAPRSVLLVHAREDLEIARGVRAALGGTASAPATS